MKNNSSTGKLTLGSRLALGFGVLILLMIALTVLGISRVSSINSGLATIGDVNSVKQRYAINFRGSVHDRAISLRDVTLLESPLEDIAPGMRADAVLFFYTHDILRTPEAVAMAAAVAPGGRVAAAGVKYYPWWAGPARP